MTHGAVFEVPRLRAIVRHAAPRVVEGTLVPLVLFFVTVRLSGVWGALAVGLGWTYGAIALRVVARRRVPGILLLGALTATVRLLLAALTGSVLVYFLQPTLGTAMVGGAFLVSLSTRRPLAERLAHDFCPLPDTMTRHPHVQRFFLRISLLWAVLFLTNAAVTLWLVLSQPVTTIVLTRPAVSGVLTGGGVALSVWWFRRSMHRHGLLGRAATVGT